MSIIRWRAAQVNHKETITSQVGGSNYKGSTTDLTTVFELETAELPQINIDVPRLLFSSRDHGAAAP